MVTINEDAVAEGAESFIVSLSALAGTSSTVGLPVPATVSIADNDNAALSMADVEVSEGDGTATVAPVIVSLDKCGTRRLRRWMLCNHRWYRHCRTSITLLLSRPHPDLCR